MIPKMTQKPSINKSNNNGDKKRPGIGSLMIIYFASMHSSALHCKIKNSYEYAILNLPSVTCVIYVGFG